MGVEEASAPGAAKRRLRLGMLALGYLLGATAGWFGSAEPGRPRVATVWIGTGLFYGFSLRDTWTF